MNHKLKIRLSTYYIFHIFHLTLYRIISSNIILRMYSLTFNTLLAGFINDTQSKYVLV